MVIILCVCARRSWLVRRDPRYFFAITLFTGGLIESGAELMFFSIGNPGSLLFMLSIAMLSTRRPEQATTHGHGPAMLDEWGRVIDPQEPWPDVA